MRQIKSIFLFLLCSIVCLQLSASVTPSGTEAIVINTKKVDKQQDRLHKKIDKIQSRIIKAKEKAGVAVLDDAGFLENADDRIRWGLVGVAGGIILSLILTTSLKFIGTLGIIAGLGLLIWYLIDP